MRKIGDIKKEGTGLFFQNQLFLGFVKEGAFGNNEPIPVSVIMINCPVNSYPKISLIIQGYCIKSCAELYWENSNSNKDIEL
jgi:hypothetical protein